ELKLPRWHSRSRLNDGAAHEKCEAGTDEDAHRVHAQGTRQPLLRKIVRDQGKSPWSERRFSDTDTHASKKQRAEASGAGAQGRHHAPEQHANRDECRATPRVCDLSDRDSQAPIEQRESKSLKQAD